jgi:hypothetical protein
MPMHGSLPESFRRNAAFLLIAAAVLSGCDRGTVDVEPEAPAPVTCAVTDTDVRRWIENPAVPAEPGSCFYDFAWQQFLALTRLEGQAPVLATWPGDQALFPASGDAEPWRTGTYPMRGRQLRKTARMAGVHAVEADQVMEAAALTPLVDQRGRWLHFSVLVNQDEYEYIRCCELYRGGCYNDRLAGIELPETSLEIKLAWRVIETCDLPDSPRPCTPEDASRFLTAPGEVQPYSAQVLDTPVKATLGLVGMHIVQKTPQNPGFLWATFEHRDNAPDCPAAGSASPSETDWLFYDAACKDPANTGRCQNNWYCPPCPVQVTPEVRDAYNAKHAGWKIPDSGVITCTPLPHTFNQPIEVSPTEKVRINLFDPATCKAAQIPTQACRETPVTAEVDALNEQVRKVLGQLGGRASMLAHYELAGVLWFAGDTLEPASGTALANTTMETYLQDPQLMAQGCVTCHDSNPTPVPAQPPMDFNSGLADRSMVFQQIRQLDATCSASQPPGCGAWAGRCPAG